MCERETADEVSGIAATAPLFVTSEWGQKVQSVLRQVAVSEVPVLFLGETGVGKEVFARYVHSQSPRAHRPFVKVNCAALPSELIESELFGFDRGAFTGAHASKPGLFELANGGTILLDEIGDMGLSLQAKLLQVLQDHSFQRLGGRNPIHVDIRIMAATHHDLERESRKGKFRDDLYYRLNVITIHVPALRDRREEILPLAEFLLRKHAPNDAAVPALPESLKRELLSYTWPGNVRELENVMRNLLVFRDTGLVQQELRRRKSSMATPVEAFARPDIQCERAQPVHRPASLLGRIDSARDEAEATAVTDALNGACWNRRVAAKMLGISYKTLLYRMKKLGITSRQMYASAENHDTLGIVYPASDDVPQFGQLQTRRRVTQSA
jgi:two-component system response regulator AtoC